MTLSRSDGVHLYIGSQVAEGLAQQLDALGVYDLTPWEAWRLAERGLSRWGERVSETRPEAWAAQLDREGEGRSVLARIAWAGPHGAIVGMRASDGERPGLLGADWTDASLREIGSHPRELAEGYASPVDIEAEPELWRARSSVDGLDVSMRVVRVDGEGTPLIVSAQPRRLRARGRGGRR